jgi:hypothetical protein
MGARIFAVATREVAQDDSEFAHVRLEPDIARSRRTGDETMSRHVMRRATTGLLAMTFVVAGLAPAAAQAPQGAAAPGGQARGRGPQTPPLLMTTTAFEDGA